MAEMEKHVEKWCSNGVGKVEKRGKNGFKSGKKSGGMFFFSLTMRAKRKKVKKR
jgi:hypothetical protein